MSAPRYTLRLSVRVLSPASVTGFDSEQHLLEGEIRVTAKLIGPHLILLATGFESEAEAQAYLPGLKRGLWNLALVHQIAFKPSFERQHITPVPDPYTAERNLAQGFGMAVEGPFQPLHWVIDEDGYAIFKAGEGVRPLLFVEASGHVVHPTDAVREALASGIEGAQSASDSVDERLATALDLYLSHFYEVSIRARFLTLVTVLEVLAPVTEKHPAAIRLVVDLHRDIDDLLKTEVDPDARDALEALRKEIDFRREKSIRRRIRCLVLDEPTLGDIPQRKGLARRIVDAYDLRSAMTHSGAIAEEALIGAFEIILAVVKSVLLGRLGLA